MHITAHYPAVVALAVVLGSVTLAPALAGSHHRQRVESREVPRAVPDRSVDTVGSIAYDGHGYGYNRITGERYVKCMFDEGYGRVEPCDAGGNR
jgi:hypothetical protein